VAGYFDGDGTIATSDISNQPFKLGLSLVFTDQSTEQIANIRNFLINHGIKTSNILKTSKGTASIVVVSQIESVKMTLRFMLPHLYKKANEAKAALDYYEGRSTGNDLLAVFAVEVEAGRREKHARKTPVDVPYTWPEGHRLMKERRKARLRDAFGRFRSRVTPEDFDRIRHDYFGGKRLCDLVKEYPQYARETIRRVIGGGRGYVGVKGIGRVDTTDTTIRDAFKAHHRAEEWR